MKFDFLNTKMNAVMKTRLFLLILSAMLFSTAGKAQIEKVIVETYYVSDANDSTDTTNGRNIPVGSKTYRVYIDLAPGYKLKRIFGTTAHPLKITSTADFYNNIDRPTEYFGYQIKRNHFNSNPTLALDSWLTLGIAAIFGTANNYSGVIKTQDTDNSTWLNNTGGTAAIPGGILKNNDASAGPPISTNDGYMTYSGTLSTWFDNGFKNGTVDTTVFGSVNTGSQFISTTAFLQQNNGVMGQNPDSNQVLIAQLTTLGTLTMELNVDVVDSTGAVTTYVASNPAGSEVLSPFLTYPTVCGCTDTRYVEYSSTYACSNPSACITLNRFGCTDSMACNYDPSANKLLPNFCCYPGYCNDRDISLVCPDLSPYKIKKNWVKDIYPNPVDNMLNIGLIYTSDPMEISYIIYDAYGNAIREQSLGVMAGNSVINADVSDLSAGLYVFRVIAGGNSTTKKFIKN
jgi:hypothetical protein